MKKKYRKEKYKRRIIRQEEEKTGNDFHKLIICFVFHCGSSPSFRKKTKEAKDYIKKNKYDYKEDFITIACSCPFFCHHF